MKRRAEGPLVVVGSRDRFRALLASGLLPDEVLARPARVGRTTDGLALGPAGGGEDVTFGADVLSGLRTAGVSVLQSGETALEEERRVCCWAEALLADPAPVPLPPLGRVLFRTGPGSELLDLCGELLRLGCDRQELGGFAGADGSGEPCAEGLLRVLDPPYLPVARALEATNPDTLDSLRAFLPERPGSRVWVEVGARHELAGRCEPPEGELLLIPRSGPWRRVLDGPWVDVADRLDLQLPPRRDLVATPPPGGRLRVSLRLTRTGRSRPASLWVLRHDAIETVERVLSVLAEREVDRLSFLASGPPAEPTVLLRGRASEKGPPALPFDDGRTPSVEAFAAWPDIPWLHVPVDATLRPLLRATRLRNLLAPDPERVVWLTPRSDDADSPILLESAPAAGFSPLADWVDHVVEARADELEPWLRGVTFAFADFVSVGVEWHEGPPSEREGGRRRSRRPKGDGGEADPDPADWRPERSAGSPVGAARGPTPEPRFLIPALDPDASRIEEADSTGELVATILGAKAPDPGDWAALEGVERRAGRARDALLCRSRVLWAAPDDTTLAEWSRSPGETPIAMLVTVLLGAAAGPGTDAVDRLRLEEWSDLLASSREELPLRISWLLTRALARLSGGDRLGLLRERDRIFERLRGGLPAAEIPRSVRFHGVRDHGERSAEAHGRLDRILRTWEERGEAGSTLEADPRLTGAYVRLLVAWGRARLGDPGAAEGDLQEARGRLEDLGVLEDPLHEWCVAALSARIAQAGEGLPRGAPLPPGLAARREALGRLERYKLDRLRQASRIVDPSTGVDAFALFGRSVGSDGRLGRLLAIDDARARARAVEELLAEPLDVDSESAGATLRGVLDLLDTLSPASASAALDSWRTRLPDLPAAARPALVEDALVLAEFLEREAAIDDLLAELARAAGELEEPVAALAGVLSRCGALLRRTGRTTPALSLLDDLLASGGAGEGPVDRLRLAVARRALGENVDLAGDVAAATGLLGLRAPDARLELVRELASALAHAPIEQAGPGFDALLGLLPEVTDSYATNSHFCLSVVHYVESLVRAVVSDELCLDSTVRRWAEEDEHDLRRRIHEDLSSDPR